MLMRSSGDARYTARYESPSGWRFAAAAGTARVEVLERDMNYSFEQLMCSIEQGSPRFSVWGGRVFLQDAAASLSLNAAMTWGSAIMLPARGLPD
jgi:hypothetical protein